MGQAVHDKDVHCEHRDDRFDDDFRRVEPIESLTAIEHQLQARDANDQTRHTDPV